MNNETYTPCTKCGRPMAYCKGNCCGKPQGCQCKEYGPKVCGAIRPGEPHCPPQAIIPSLTVESVSNLKDLADCFVHVSDINTTFYIDDKHRIMTTWAGLVSVEDYDFDANPLNLRGQIAYDSKNNVAAIYDKQGVNYIFQISDIDNNYMLLENKPRINGVTLEGNKTSADLGIPEADKVALVFDTVADMQSATGLEEGQCIRTKGYYSVGDGGSAEYVVKTSSTGKYEELSGGLVAELLLDDSHIKYFFPKGWDNPSGNGDISLIQAYGKNILIDTYRDSNYSDVEDFLQEYGVSHIDYLILSHYHDDHVGNFENLLDDDYIDSNTVIYLPAYSSLMSGSALSYYNSINTLISSYSLTSLVPTEGSTLTLGTSLKITFFNCETSIFTEMGYTNYNDCSTVCLVEHGESKALFAGDCQVSSSNRLIDNGLITTSVNLYKLSHHGINDGVSNTFKRFVDVINPDYAVQLSSLNDAELGKYSTSSQLYFLQAVGSKIYSSYKNTDNMVFESDNKTINANYGISTDSIANLVSETNFYVDSSTVNEVQNGTQTYPFKELAQALGECGKTSSRYAIHLADGNYNLTNNIALNIEECDVEIVGNTADNTKAVIYSAININESSVKFSYCTISNENGSISLYAHSSLIIDHCIITNLTEKAGNGIWTQDLKSNSIEITTSTFKDLVTGITAKYCDVAVYTTTFNNVTTAMNLQRCTLIDKANTYTSVTTKVNYNTYSTSLLPNQRVALASGIDVKTGTITISDSIRNYNKLLIISGYTGDGTMVGSTCYSYGDDKFNNGVTYNAKSYNDDIYITPSNNTTLTITRSSGTPDKGIRKIYGYIENTI